MVAPNRLDKLVALLVDDAEREVARERDRALGEARRQIAAAEDEAAQWRRAAAELGRLRGRAVDQAEAEAARRELETLRERAFEALGERFLARVLLALGARAEGPDRAGVLARWARPAAACVTGPVEVFCARRDRDAVYEALLGAGLADFRVLADHRVHAGFVLRDLDGRTLVDRRPEALVAERRAELLAGLAAQVPAFGPGPLDGAAPAAADPTRAGTRGAP